jgi:phosphoenolpyruvate phosphomutase
MKEWGGRMPVVIVPTKYYTTPTIRFHELGINLVIWANHNLRASIEAMKKISGQIYQEESLIHVEGGVATLEEVFRLQRTEELQAAELKYLPSRGMEPEES